MKLFFVDVVRIKIVKLRFGLVKNIFVLSGRKGFSAAFNMKFIVVMSTRAKVISDVRREKR